MYGQDLFLILIGLAITVIAQIYVSITFAKYKKIQNSKGISGFEVAKAILDNNGLSNIYVTETKGMLADHYDASRKVVRLSTEIFHGTTIAASSVAAHEVGHAIQDKEGYSFMRIRSAIFPLVNISSYIGYIAIMIGLVFGPSDLILVGIVLEMVILLFQIITLPVEFNASKRAKEELQKYKLVNTKELQGSAKMLNAAALTYVAAVLTTLLQVVRLILIYGNRRD